MKFQEVTTFDISKLIFLNAKFDPYFNGAEQGDCEIRLLKSMPPIQLEDKAREKGTNLILSGIC